MEQEIDINKKVLRIMLVDDDKISNLYNEFVIREQLNFTGELKICLNGKEAIDYLRNKATESDPKYPDLILLDINMPVMNGFEFIEEHNKIHPEIRSHIILCMLTSSLDTKDFDKVKECNNMIDYLHKPLSKSSLTGVIEKFF